MGNTHDGHNQTQCIFVNITWNGDHPCNHLMEIVRYFVQVMRNILCALMYIFVQLVLINLSDMLNDTGSNSDKQNPMYFKSTPLIWAHTTDWPTCVLCLALILQETTVPQDLF